MKKILLSALSLLVAGIGFAQTTIDTALDLDVTGDNSYTTETTGTTVYWKYTSNEDAVISVSPNNGSIQAYELVTDEDTGESTPAELKSIYSYSYTDGVTTYTYYYPARSGHTIYFSVTGYNGGTFGLKVNGTEQNKGVGKGTDESSPLELETDYRYFLGTYCGSGYSFYSYATYNATEDGVLVLSTSAYSTVYVNGSDSPASYTSSYDYSTGTTTYTVKQPVEAGQTYTFKFSLNNPIYITAAMTKPERGSLDNPIALNIGENSLPAAYGDYYYTYTNTTAGYAQISSEDNLPAGQVKVYSSLSNVSYNYPYATSNTGSFDVKFETPTLNNTYYICISKIETTDNPQTFTLSLEEYAPGDKEANPILITDIPSQITCKNTNASTYYAIELPANEPAKFLNISGTNVTNSYTQVSVYEEGSYSYYGTNGYGSVKAEVSNNTGSPKRYIIMWAPYNETEAVTFDISYETIEQGDLITNPIEAVKGDNRLPSSGTKYYKYTATINGKIVVTSPSPETTFTFPKGTGQYDGSYTATVSGTKYTLEVNAGTTYYIQVTNAVTDEVFTLDESEFGPGESRDTAVDVEGDEYVFGNETLGNLWLKYTMKQDGVLKIACDLDYNYQNSITYGKATEQTMTQMTKTNADYFTSYEAETVANEGDVYLVNLKLSTIYEGNKVTFTEREAEAGESAAKAIIIAKEETVAVPKSDRTKPVWYKIYLKPGDVKLSLNGSIQGAWYSDEEKAASETGESFYTTFDNETTSYYYNKTISEDAAAGWQYIKLYGNYNEISLVVTGDAVVAQGDVIDWPLEAVAGDNTVDGEGTKYYTYTTTIDGRMSVTVYDNSTTVSFPRGTDEGDNYETTVEETTSTIEVTEGTEHIIRIDGAAAGSVFTLGETEYAEGEIREKPITVENGEYTLTYGQSAGLWLEYTVEKTGFLTIECNVPYSDENVITYGKAADEELAPLADENTNRYSRELEVTAGDVYLVNLILNEAYEGYKVTFTENEKSTTAIAPAHNTTTVRLDGRTLNINVNNANVSIYDMAGRKIAAENVSGNRTYSLSAGIYLINIDGNVRKIQVK